MPHSGPLDDTRDMIKKNSPLETPASPGVNDVPSTDWPAWKRRLVGAVALGHLFAVFLAPLNFSCENGSSPFVRPVHTLFRPYIDAMYLDHGYFFFAPNPGPSHLVRYKLEFDDGRPEITGTFPNLKENRPRLMYHRYFMLAESLNNTFVPPEGPIKGTPPLDVRGMSDATQARIDKLLEDEFATSMKAWKHRRGQYEALKKSIGDHLCYRYGAKSATITRVEHFQLSPDISRALDLRLDLPLTYRDLPEAIQPPEVIKP